MWEVMGMLMLSMVGMVSHMYTYRQPHQVVYIKYAQIFTYHISIKWFKKKLIALECDRLRGRGYGGGNENVPKLILVMVAKLYILKAIELWTF